MQVCCTLDVSLDAGVLYFGCFFKMQVCCTLDVSLDAGVLYFGYMFL